MVTENPAENHHVMYETLWNPVKQWGKLPVNYLTYLSTGVADFSQPSTVTPSGSLVQKCPGIHFEEVDLHHQTQTRCMGWSPHHLRGRIPEDTEFGELVQCWHWTPSKILTSIRSACWWLFLLAMSDSETKRRKQARQILNDEDSSLIQPTSSNYCLGWISCWDTLLDLW